MNKGTPGQSDRRRTRQGGVRTVDTSNTVAAPALRPGQVRCPVCLRGAKTTPRGFLWGHTDLFGHPCHNRRAPAEAAP